MQKIVNLVSKVNKEFNLIENGDKIAVAVSGGKDSLVLLECLSIMRRYFEIKFDLIAITINLKFHGKYDDFSEVAKLCKKNDVPYIIYDSDIVDIVFNIRKEKSACSLCSKLRKGLINSIAKQHECNKVALAHSLDDTVETFLMNLFSSGKFSCFGPKNFLSRAELIQIRPMVFLSETKIEAVAKKLNLPVVKSRCYVDGQTNRQVMKNFLKREEAEFKNIKTMVFGAISRSKLEGWVKEAKAN